jgi:hypothetical protein
MYNSIKKMAAVAALGAVTLFGSGCKSVESDTSEELNACYADNAAVVASLEHETASKLMCISDLAESRDDLVESEFNRGVCEEKNRNLETENGALTDANEGLTQDNAALTQQVQEQTTLNNVTINRLGLCMGEQQSISTTLSVCEADRDKALQDHQTASEERDALSERLFIIESDCKDIACYRADLPLGESVSTVREFLGTSYTVDGEFLGAIYAIDDDDLTHRVFKGLNHDLENMIENVLWEDFGWESRRSSYPVNGFYVNLDNPSESITMADGDYNLQLIVDSEHPTLAINGELYPVSEGELFTLPNGTGIMIQSTNPEPIYGIIIDYRVMNASSTYTLEERVPIVGEWIEDVKHRIELIALPFPIDDNDEFFQGRSYIQETYVSITTREESSGRSFLYSELESFRDGEVEYEEEENVGFLFYDLNYENKTVTLTVLPGIEDLEEEYEEYDVQVSIPEPTLTSSLPPDYLQHPSTIIVDEACGPLAMDYLVHVEKMDPSVDCETIRQNIITGPTTFSRNIDGNIVTLVTGLDDRDLRDAAELEDHFIRDY